MLAFHVPETSPQKGEKYRETRKVDNNLPDGEDLRKNEDHLLSTLSELIALSTLPVKVS